MKRVLFKKCPLAEVILQVRFPTILSINTKEPADFQEIIRIDYPIYQPGIESQQELQIVANNDTFMPSIINKQQNKNYAFISADGKYKINLTSSFISLSTISYTRWEEFSERFVHILKAFTSIYKPPFFERIGLRYVDIISKKTLELEDKAWKDLIKDQWLGPLASIDDKKVATMNTNTEFILDDNITRVKVHTGLGNINGSLEQAFVADTDFIYIDTIPLGSANEILTTLHDHSRFFVKEIITELLYYAMEPTELE